MVASRRQSHAPSRPAGADAAALAGLFLVALLALLAFRHRGGIADPDAVAMAAGMANGLHAGVPFRDSMLYGRLVSPGSYLLFRAVYPLFFRDPAHTMDFLNGLGLAAGVLLPLPAFALYRRRFTTAAAFACTLLVVLAPLVWEAGCSFHPIGLAVLLLLLAMLAFGRSRHSRHGAAWFALSAAIGFAGLSARAEIALAIPALLLAAARWPGAPVPGARRRALAAAAAIALACAAFLALSQAVAGAGGESGGGLVAYARGFLAAYFSLAPLARSVVWAAFAIGILTVAGAAGGLLAIRRWRAAAADPGARAGLLIALVWALPPLLFWLPNQTVVLRHFFLAVPALAWIAGETVLSRTSRPLLVAGTAAMLAGNLLVPELAYRAWNRAHPADPKAPNGAFLSWHAREAALIARDRRAADLALCRGANAGAYPTDRCPGAFIAVDWGSYGYLLYGMACGGHPFTLLSTSSPHPQLTLYRYRHGEVEIHALMAQIVWAVEPGPLRDATRAALVAGAREARGRGWSVVLPREVIAARVVPEEDGPAPLGY